ncbi:MAG: 2-oxoacid:acceptor oxidoreductase family protein [Deltaproteobacteria bacterium]|nr:2-oxoacid:acceptor oxidoreductase family protein [Deltaproteobacteria bacterium]
MTKNATDRYEIRFGGSGGQGILFAALVLAEAAGVYGGKYVCQSQSYGPETRGGFSRADVVISHEPIDYPMAMKPDLLLAMNQAACDNYYPDLKPDGLLVVDSSLVREIPTSRAVTLAFTRIAHEKFGNDMVANMVSLGAVAQLSRAATLKNIRNALIERAPKGTQEINMLALDAGIKIAKKIDLSSLPGCVFSEEEEV